MTKRSDDPEFIEAIARGIDVLCSFTPYDPPLTLSQIAQRTGLARPTVRRILLTLEELGYLSIQEGRFALTARVLDLGYAYVHSKGSWEMVRPHLESLAATTHQSCSIAKLDGSDIIYVARAAVQKLVSLSVHIGTRFPAYATSLGKVLLADLPSNVLRSVLQTPSRSHVTALWHLNYIELETELEAVRHQGWALTDQQLALGIRSIALPLRSSNGRAIASINVNAAASEIEPETMILRYLPPLLEAQRLIEADLLRLNTIPVIDIVDL
jgi:IclR family pca regulon transcriptional regulator